MDDPAFPRHGLVGMSFWMPQPRHAPLDQPDPSMFRGHWFSKRACPELLRKVLAALVVEPTE
jgi:hypothetical protein